MRKILLALALAAALLAGSAGMARHHRPQLEAGRLPVLYTWAEVLERFWDLPSQAKIFFIFADGPRPSPACTGRAGTTDGRHQQGHDTSAPARAVPRRPALPQGHVTLSASGLAAARARGVLHQDGHHRRGFRTLK